MSGDLRSDSSQRMRISEVLGSKVLVETPRYRLERRLERLPDGVVQDRDVIVHPGAVVVLPVLADGSIVLIRQYRPTVRRWLIELPAGTLEPDESPASAATRELREETGYSAGVIEPWFEFYAAPGLTDERMFVFVARELTQGETALEAGECAEVVVASLEEILPAMDAGEIEDAKTLCVLERFSRERTAP